MEHAAMDHGFMQGMLWGSLLMMSVPILVGLGIGFYALRQWLGGQDGSAAGEPPPAGGSDESGGDGGSRAPRLPRAPELDDPDRAPVAAGGPAAHPRSAR